jgi:hypothetical protein
MSSPRPSWRPLLAGTIGLFLVILAFLAGQLRSGGDPALGRSAAAQQTTQGAPPASSGSGTDPAAPADPSESDGFIPGGTAPAPAVPDGSSPGRSDGLPATHQS